MGTGVLSLGVKRPGREDLYTRATRRDYQFIYLVVYSQFVFL